MKIAFETLGCKLNQAETEQLARQFAAAGYELVLPEDEADIYVLNTCTVTRMADAKSRQLLRQAHRHNPNAIVVAAGCYAERAANEIKSIEGVSLVVGNAVKADLLTLLEESGCRSVIGPASVVPEDGQPFRTRSFVKIQDGCSNFCTYCIVPLVRGREKSRPAGSIIEEIKRLLSEGVREVVLTGTEIGSYFDDGADLKELIERVLAETGVERLRLSSLQPQETTPELIELWRDERLCPHFHLSLQSGSDNVLRRMNRRYDIAGYTEAVNLIRSVVPGAAITTDVIAGFPGETDDEFEESLEFCRRTGFSRLHVFSYSPRPGTAAERMTPPVPDGLRTQRNQKLRALGKESMRLYARRFLGVSMPVLWEQKSGETWSGYTPNYIRVYSKNDEDLTNRITPVKLVKVWKDGVWGEVE